MHRIERERERERERETARWRWLGAITASFVDTAWLMVLLPMPLAGIAVYFLVGPKASDEDVHARLTPFVSGAVAGRIGFYDGLFGLALVTLLGMGLTMVVGQVLGGWQGSHAAMRFGPRLIRPFLVVICFGMVAKLRSDPANPIRLWISNGVRSAGAR